MDPLSITASIVAILQLTNEVVEYLADVKDAPKDCQQCLTELRNLQSPLISLRCRAEQTQTSDPWIKQLQELNVKGGPLDQCYEAIKLLRRHVDIRAGEHKIRTRLLWKFKKDEVEKILKRVERLKSLIIIALTTDHLKLSEAIQKDIASLQDTLLPTQAAINTIENSTRSVKDDTKSIRDTQHQEQDRAVLEWLSSTSYPAQQQDIISRRQEGTAQWFLDSVEFKQWIQGRDKTLFCPGIPGAGKTVMAAVAIDYLSRTYNDSIGIAYIFCSYKSQDDQSISSLLAAILKQLALSNIDNTPLKELHNKHSKRGSRPALDELLSTLALYVNCSTTYIIIDALDECSSKDNVRNQLINILISLQARSEVRLLFTSRFIPEIKMKFESDPQLEVRASEEDIQRYIEGQKSRLPSCIQRDITLQTDVQNKIAQAVDGMFLLARLHVDSVCDQITLKDVRKTLASLKKGSEALDNAYKDALFRINEQGRARRLLAQQALCWVSYARRPLTVQELRIALAIKPGEDNLDPEDLADIEDIISVCAGLLTIDQESNIVRLVHYTTQEYLESIRLTWAPDMQYKIAEACLSYLSFEEFRSGSCTNDAKFEQRLAHFQFFDYSARFWSSHARPVEHSITKSAMNVLYRETSLASIIQVISTPSYTYLGYSSKFPRGFTAAHLLADRGLSGLLQHFIESELDDENNIINSKDSYARTPIYYASRSGHEQVVKLLLDKGAELNAQDKDYNNALHAASIIGHEQVVKLLLDKGADVNAQGGRYSNALQAASFYGHELVVKLLLDKGADVNAQGGRHGNAIQAASTRGHEQIVKLLLFHGANPQLCSLLGWSLFQISLVRGHLEIFEQLWRRATHCDRDHRNSTPTKLHDPSIAAMIKDFLLSNEGSQSNCIVNGWSLLHWACKAAVPQAIEELLKAGLKDEYITVSEPTGEWSASSLAAYHGNALSFGSTVIVTDINNDNPALQLLPSELPLEEGSKISRHCDGCNFVRTPGALCLLS